MNDPTVKPTGSPSRMPVMTVTPVARDYDGTVGVQLDVGLSGIIAGDDVDVVRVVVDRHAATLVR